MNDKDSENKSAVVPKGAKQVEEIYGRWPWVERNVWSERMLQAIANLGYFRLEKARGVVLHSH